MMERGIKKIFTFVMRKVASKILGKITLKPLEFRKDKFHKDDRTDTNFIFIIISNKKTDVLLRLQHV